MHGKSSESWQLTYLIGHGMSQLKITLDFSKLLLLFILGCQFCLLNDVESQWR